ncbi:cell division protein FtsQ/DivIB [Corynebacterium sp. YSMAA1_1_D6]|uniref:cell division protein FtsQ/DivIB n=1 Tax=unclassified Corynebacterium TaxID=2624378 RepID=UPI0026007D27|nr:FtsQ-type POTRA domain-containing protein [Corynebacterium sp.]
MSKRTGVLAGGAVLLVAIVAAVVVWAVPILKVSSFEVEGNAHVTPEDVERASGVAKGSNLVRLDAHAAAGGVAQLPWVESATVSRAFPSTVHIEVIEHEAVAFVHDGDQTVLVDNQGKEFATDTPPAEAIELTGHTDSGSPEMQAAVDAVSALPAEVREKIKTLEVRGTYDLTFKTKDDKIIYWGAAEDNANKAIAFEDVLKLEGTEWNISNPALVTSR